MRALIKQCPICNKRKIKVVEGNLFVCDNCKVMMEPYNETVDTWKPDEDMVIGEYSISFHMYDYSLKQEPVQ